MLSTAIFKKQHHFKIKNSDSIGIVELIKNPNDIDKNVSRSILVEAFIGEYEQYLSPSDIEDDLTSWRDGDKSVQKYYENYFDDEFAEFSKGHLHFWVKATINGELVGWATFQREKSDPNSVYMNLLIVHPAHQHKRVGQQLILALMNLGEIKDLNAVHLLLRKKNKGGRVFYSKLGFYSDAEYQREDNFVKLDRLEGFTWRNPKLFSQLDASMNGSGNPLTPLQESLLKGFVGFSEPTNILNEQEASNSQVSKIGMFSSLGSSNKTTPLQDALLEGFIDFTRPTL